MDKFITFNANHIFNKFEGNIKKDYSLKYLEVEINYPCRLDAMAINPAAVCYNDNKIFTPGEVVISTKKYINVKVKKIEDKEELVISDNTRRKVLAKHAYYLMKDVLNFSDSLYIDVNDDDIPKHTGFGSSSSTIAAVAAAINEMYGCPIDNNDLIKYLASNHGEEVSDQDEENLKLVQCIGGGATNGLTKEGIIIIAGHATSIAKMNYDGDILIGLPNDFVIKDAEFLMDEEEKNLWKFKRTGDKYSKDIAYNLLHKAIPDMVNGSIKELANVVFDYRFNMGSIENCSFVYPNMIEQAKVLRKLYENNYCEFLALSSVGPAYFVIVKDEKQKKKCKRVMENLNMKITETKVNNDTYKVVNYKDEIFWNKKETRIEFENMSPKKYITDEIDKFKKNSSVLDIGCGGGRYSRYLKKKGYLTTAMDKYPQMSLSLKKDNIEFYEGTTDNIPFREYTFDNLICIGVLHNVTSLYEYKKSIKEMYRVLNDNGYLLFSVFTNDVISDDLVEIDTNLYDIDGREPMILLSKEEIKELMKQNNFELVKEVEEHITDVGSGCRNVYTILLKK